MGKIYDTTYKGFPGVCLENDQLRAVFLPDQGAKLCSLVWKANEVEYIYQGKTTEYRTSQYGQNYLDGECAGVDEMFPTIDAEYYKFFPWEGTYFPDHGELWALHWETEMDKESLKMSVHSIKLPCVIRKKVGLLKDKLHMEYELENQSEFPIHYIWAAHMMFRGEKNARFKFENNLSKAYVVMSDSGTIGKYGESFMYPFVHCEDGNLYDISIHRGSDVSDYQKFYFADKLQQDQGWGSICYPDGSCLTVNFPVDEIPYLGVVQAEGGNLDLRCMFLEPCTGMFDSTLAAYQHDMVSILKPKEIKKWYIDIGITNIVN